MRRRIWMVVAALCLIAIGLATCQGLRGCKRGRGDEFAVETASWLAAVRAMGGNGMWLVCRGYHLGDDLVAVATNSPLSHAVVLDLDREEVIEAVGNGVVVTSLDAFLRDSHRLQIIRPANWTPELGRDAVARARGVVGKGYDFLGIVGAPSDDHFYCSELAAWSIGIEVDRPGPNRVLHPRQMAGLGKLLFESAERDGAPDYSPP